MNLPPGPYRYRPEEHDDWGFVRDANGDIVANTCSPGLADKFSVENSHISVHGSPSKWHDGPLQARAVTELLIRAQREADETELTAEWLVSVGFVIHERERHFRHSKSMIITEYWIGPEDQPLCLVESEPLFHASLGVGEFPEPPAELPNVITRGQLRKLAAVLGIELKEPT